MTFETPIWLYLTPVVSLLMLGLALLGLRRKESALARFAAARLLSRLTTYGSTKRSLIKSACIILSATLIAFAMARPQLGVEWTERQARGLDIVFVLDTSKSMLATDLRPTRLDRAKLAIRDIITRLESDRIGLVAFAGNAFLQTPPTLDYAAFRESLDSIGPEIMTRGGSNLGSALREAAKAFPQENNFKVCILLTDGEDLRGDALEAAKEITKENIKLHSIGIGTPEGEYLRIRGTNGTEEFVRDDQGQPVRSQLDEATLQEIAQITEGAYFRLSNQSLNQLYESVLATLPRKELTAEKQEIRIERFQWFLGAALFLVVFEKLIRRRTESAVIILLLAASLFPNQSAEAQNNTEPPPPEALAAEPANLPEDPRQQYNLGVEQLSAGDYANALQTLDASIRNTKNLRLQADALYNQAHALNQLGENALRKQDFQKAIEQWKEAEARFQSAREINPKDAQASKDAEQLKIRRQALEEFLEQQEQEQSEDQEQQEGDSESDDQESSEQNSEQSEGSENQEQDSESQEQADSGQSQQESGNDSQQQSESDQNGESDQSQTGQESDKSEQGNESENTGSENNEGQGSDAPESTGNPADDIQEQSQEEFADPENPGEPASQNQSGQESGDEQGGGATAAGNENQQTMETISIREARELLDSLQQSERLLPFTPNQPSDGTTDRRDW